MAAIDQLKGKQRAFVEQYLLNPDATKAALAAGYSKRTAHSIGHENLSKPKIQAALDEARAERSERVKVDADYVLRRLVEIDQLDVADIFTDEGEIKPIRDWPKAWRQYLSGMDVAEMFEGRGDDREMIGLLKKIKWPDKVKNLELIGKHVQVQAWREQIGLEVTDRASALKRARERAKGSGRNK